MYVYIFTSGEEQDLRIRSLYLYHCCSLHYFHHSLASGKTTGREHSPAHQQKIGLKMVLPIRTRPSLPSVSFSIRKLPKASYPSPAEGRQTENHNHRKLNNLITALSNSMKLWAMPCRATQDGQDMVDRSNKMWPTGKGNGKPLQYSCLENPVNSMERQKRYDTLKYELPMFIGALYATGDQWKSNSRKNEDMEPKQKQHSIVDMTGDGSKVQCYKEQYCIATWNVRSMNQCKLEVVKQEMARVSIDILGISKLKWTEMGEFNSDENCIYYCGQQSLRRNGVAMMVNKRVWNAVLGCNLRNDRMISVRFQGKPFNITVIQVYAATSNAEEAEVERFYEDIQDLLELTTENTSF